MVNKPGVFWAGYSSSGVVEAITNFWDYFEPIRLNMPQNCSTDVQSVVSHIDDIFSGTDMAAIQSVKSNFGLGNVTHLDDFGTALRSHFGYWQLLELYTRGGGGPFYDFCDALEVKGGQNAPASGWGLDYSLEAWGSYWNNTYYDQACGTSTPDDCWGTYDGSTSYFTNTTVDNADRSWSWMVCNEVGWFQESAPKDHPSLILRVLTPSYDLRQCGLMFPGAFPTGADPQVNRTNDLYQGWNVRQDRLFFANGLRDPWRGATVSADGANVPSTDSQPIAVSDGFHCSDLATASGAVDATAREVQEKALQYMDIWLKSWQPSSQ
ncbi:hypothetical protein H0H93_002272 [Arthromyces matolae]|nr:hypothetical protein H0H93_002272 [Arthromyces matolae]